MVLIRHPQSWVEPQELGSHRPYRPTHDAIREIGATHLRLLEAPLKPGTPLIDIGVPGSLRREDAAKLYELAYFGTGDILELGCAHGLSTAIVAQAIFDSGRTAHVTSVDLSSRMIEFATTNLASYNLLSGVEFVQGDAAFVCKALVAARRTFGFVFIDHSHRYDDVLVVSQLLSALIDSGGFALFHDFNDPRNTDSSNIDYGVYSGVIDGLPNRAFEFYGVFGCCGLYRHMADGAEPGMFCASPILGAWPDSKTSGSKRSARSG